MGYPVRDVYFPKVSVGIAQLRERHKREDRERRAALKEFIWKRLRERQLWKRWASCRQLVKQPHECLTLVNDRAADWFTDGSTRMGRSFLSPRRRARTAVGKSTYGAAGSTRRGYILRRTALPLSSHTTPRQLDGGKYPVGILTYLAKGYITYWDSFFFSCFVHIFSFSRPQTNMVFLNHWGQHP